MTSAVRGSLAILVFTAVAFVASGCAVVPVGSDGAGASRPHWMQLRQAAASAASDPWVWAPLAGAAVLQIDNWDHRVSSWARSHAPLFGSERNAKGWSNDLLTTTAVLDAASFLAIPPHDDSSGWAFEKARDASVELSAIGATIATTAALKTAASRERPNQENRQSFPSGHASGASVTGRLAAFNLESIDVEPTLRRAADFGIDALELGTGWARVEAGCHYPADALAGIALGNFFASVATRAFMSSGSVSSFSVATTPNGAVLHWQMAFR